MKTKLLIILIIFVSLTSYSQDEFYELTKNEIRNSISTLGISFNTPNSNTGVFFATNLIVENPELNPCVDITSNKLLNESIIGVIEKFNLFQEIFVEGEDGITEINSGKLTDLKKNSLNIYLYYDSNKTMGSVYLVIKSKTEAKRFISELIETIGYKYCLKKLKRKI